MKPNQLYEEIKNILPEPEKWDNEGLAVDCGKDIKKVLIALDATTPVIEKAISLNADCIITHHPLLFDPLTQLSVNDHIGKRVICCIKNKISLISFHTSLDSYNGGVSDCLCKACNIKDTQPYLPFARVGYLDTPMQLDKFAEQVEAALGCKVQNIGGNRTVHKVAVLSGSGKSYVEEAVATGADTYLTGELSLDTMIQCTEYGINYICGTHFATEAVVLPVLKELVLKCNSQIGVEIYAY